MMKRLYPIFFTLIISIFLVGCFDNTPALETFFAFGTVENPSKKPTNYHIRLDNDTLLCVSSSSLLNYTPEDGQRIFAEFHILADVREEEGPVSYDIHLQYVNEMLTKEVLQITPEMEDSIGNDKVGIEAMWIGSKYLNTLFYIFHFEEQHYINLVSDVSKEYDDEKIHLEFRHNSKDDRQINRSYGYASFDISSLQSATSDSVDIVVHVKPYDKESKSEYGFTYKYKPVEPEEVAPRALIKRLDDYILMDEIK